MNFKESLANLTRNQIYLITASPITTKSLGSIGLILVFKST